MCVHSIYGCNLLLNRIIKFIDKEYLKFSTRFFCFSQGKVFFL